MASSRSDDDNHDDHSKIESSEIINIVVKSSAEELLKHSAALGTAGALFQFLEDKKLRKPLEHISKAAIPFAEAAEKFIIAYPTVENAIHHGENTVTAMIKGAAVAVAIEQGMHALDKIDKPKLLLNLIGDAFSDRTLRARIAKDAAKGIIKIKMLSPLAHVFIFDQQLKSKGYHPITSAIATTIGVMAGMGANALGTAAIVSGAVETVGAPPLGIPSIIAGGSLISASSHLAQTVAENTAAAIAKISAQYPRVQSWISKKTRELVDKLNDIKIISDAKGADILHNEITEFAHKTLSEAKAHGLSDDNLVLFGYLLQLNINQRLNCLGQEEKPYKKDSVLDPITVFKEVDQMQRKLDDSLLLQEVKLKIQQKADAEQILMDIITDIDIHGYDNNDEITRLHAKLESQKQAKVSYDEIYDTARSLKKAVADEANKRQEFDKHIENVVNIGGMVSSVASLLGKDKLSQQIGGVVAAGQQIGKAIVSQLGYGLLAGSMNPVAAGAAILGGCAQLVGLFKKQKDPSQAMFRMLQSIQDELVHFREHNDKRFDEVMGAIGDVNSKIIIGFMQCDWKLNVSIEQLFKLTKRLDEGFSEQREVGATVNKHLHEIKELLSKESQSSVISDLVTEVGTMVSDDKADEKYAQYIATLEAKTLSPLTGAMSSSVIGDLAIVDEYPATKEGLAKLAKPFNRQHAYFFINRLLTYFNSLRMNSDYYYNKNEMEIILKSFLKDQSNLHLPAIVELGDLLLGDSARPDDYAGEMIGSLAECIRNAKANDRYLLPIIADNGWRLLLIDNNNYQVHFYGEIDLISDRISDIVISHPKLGKHSFYLHPSILTININPLATSLLVIEQARLICKGEDLMNLTTTLASDSLDQLNIKNRAILKEHAQQLSTPANPLLWQYLSWALINMTDKTYPDTQRAQMSYSEIARQQRFINHGVYLANILHRLRNPELFKLILSQYSFSAAQLAQELENEKTRFEIQQMDFQKQTMIQLINTMLDSGLLRQSIPVSTDHGSWFHGCIDQIHTHKVGDNISGTPEINPIYSDPKKTAYVTAQNRDITAISSSHIEHIERMRSAIKLNGILKLGNPSPILYRLLPSLLYPTNSDHPVLPMRMDIAQYLPDIYFEAQNADLGRIKCYYSINNKEFIIAFHFETTSHLTIQQSKFCEIKLSYNPLFYTGREAVWHYWCGGNFPTNVNNLTKTFAAKVQGGSHRVWWEHYVFVPVCQHSQGMYNLIIKKISSAIKDCALEADKIAIRNAIDNFNDDLTQKWHTHLITKINSNEESALGKSITQFNACFELLRMFAELILNISGKPIDMLIDYVSQHQTFVWNLQGLLHKVSLNQLINPSLAIVSQKEVADLRGYLKHVFATIHQQSYTPRFNLGLLLQAFWERFDIFVPKMKPGKTLSEKAKESRQHLNVALKAMDIGAQILSDFADLSPEMMVKRALQMAAAMKKFADMSRDQLVLQDKGHDDAMMPQIAGLLADMPIDAASGLIQYSIFNQGGQSPASTLVHEVQDDESQIIDIGIDSALLPFKLVRGFSGGEKTHRWLDGKEAVLTLPLFSNGSRIIQICFETSALVSETHLQRLIISGNGLERQIIDYDVKNPSRKIVINIKTDYLGDIEINFEMPNACQPKVVDPKNDDPRYLSIAFQTAHLNLRESPENKLKYE